MDEKRLIDANALSRAVCGIGKDIKRPRAVELMCLVLINEALTVDAVEVVHGRWLKTCIPDIYHCTNCKRATKMDELCDSEILRAYCPNCGAKMDGDGNG